MVINFFGRRGSGKTTAIRGNIRSYRRPVVIVDILGNFTDHEFFHTTDLKEAIHAVGEYHRSKSHPVICLKTSDPIKAAEFLSSAIWHIRGGTLVLDEVDSIQIEEGGCFDQYIRYGRNHDGDLITGCRRPAEIDRNLTAAANKFYCFQTHEFRDIEYFRNSVFGDTADGLMVMPKFSGLFIDYDKHLTGKFYIDRSGQVYHTEENAF